MTVLRNRQEENYAKVLKWWEVLLWGIGCYVDTQLKAKVFTCYRAINTEFNTPTNSFKFARLDTKAIA